MLILLYSGLCAGLTEGMVGTGGHQPGGLREAVQDGAGQEGGEELPADLGRTVELWALSQVGGTVWGGPGPVTV